MGLKLSINSSPPLFPITRDMFSDNVSFHSFVPGETLTLGLHDTIETSLFIPDKLWISIEQTRQKYAMLHF